MIDHRSHCAARGLAFSHQDQHAGKFLSLIRTEFERSSAYSHPEFLRCIDILHEQMNVAHRSARVIRGSQLRPRYSGHEKCREAEHKHHYCFHFSLLNELSRTLNQYLDFERGCHPSARESRTQMESRRVLEQRHNYVDCPCVRVIYSVI